MKKIDKKITSIISRYFLLLFLSFKNLQIIYIVFTPLTTYSAFFLFKIFFNASLVDRTISFAHCPQITIINACVAGAAYYFFLMLNLSTPKIKITKRLKLLGVAFATFFVFNILRIFLLGVLLINDSSIFNPLHKFLWYLGSTFLVVIIWFAEVKIFNIKNIPFYSDIKFLYKIK